MKANKNQIVIVKKPILTRSLLDVFIFIFSLIIKIWVRVKIGVKYKELILMLKNLIVIVVAFKIFVYYSIQFRAHQVSNIYI
jgi:predicted nucleic acid binding AN1-type Zn finger protein